MGETIFVVVYRCGFGIKFKFCLILGLLDGRVRKDFFETRVRFFFFFFRILDRGIVFFLFYQYLYIFIRCLIFCTILG